MEILRFIILIFTFSTARMVEILVSRIRLTSITEVAEHKKSHHECNKHCSPELRRQCILEIGVKLFPKYTGNAN